MENSEVINTETQETPEPSAVFTSKFSNKWLKVGLLGVAGVIFASGLVFAGYWWGIQNSSRKVKKMQLYVPTITPIKTLIPTLSLDDETVDWKTYRDDESGFEISYPEEWRVEKDCVAGLKSEYTAWKGVDCLKSPDFRGYLGVPANEIEQGTAIIFGCDKRFWEKSTQSILEDCLKDKQKFPNENYVCELFKGQDLSFVETRPNEYLLADETAHCSIIIEPIAISPAPVVKQILSTFKFLD